MTKISLPVKTTYGSAFKCLLFVSLGPISLCASQAQASYKCPPGQILRVSKNVCEPKSASLTFLKQKKARAAISASTVIRAVVKDRASASLKTPPAKEAPVVDA